MHTRRSVGDGKIGPRIQKVRVTGNESQGIVVGELSECGEDLVEEADGECVLLGAHDVQGRLHVDKCETTSNGEVNPRDRAVGRVASAKYE